MDRQNKASKTTDFAKKTKEMTKLNQEKSHELETMLRQVAAK